MFWNRERSPNYGYHLTPVEFENNDALIKMDSGWNGYTSLFPSDDILVKMTAAEMAEHAGFKADNFQSNINLAIKVWRNNPSGSLINILKDTNQGSEGLPMFSNIREQSQVIASAIMLKVISERDMTGVWGGEYQKNKNTNELIDKKEPWRLSSDFSAMTALGEQATKINAIGRAFRIWEERNRAMLRNVLVKVPNKLYRGIRDMNLEIEHQSVERELSRYERDVFDYHIRRNEMLTKNMADFSHSEILSFTSSKSIAEYFANQRGTVVEISTEDVSIVSGWSLDEELSGKDYVNNKDEKEWIVRVGDYKLKPENLINANEDIAFVSRDPMGISMVKSNSIKAYYDINDKPILCKSVWNNSGTKASLVFDKRDDGERGLISRSEFKKHYGFDPLPSEKDKVENLEYFRYEEYTSKKDKAIPHIDITRPIEEILNLPDLKM